MSTPTNTAALLKAGKLACPSCGDVLGEAGGLSCTGCGIEFPNLRDIPVLVSDPGEYLASWIQQFRNFIMGEQNNIQYEQSLIGSPSTYPPFRDRLKTVIKARMENLQTLANLMTPLRDAGAGLPLNESITSAAQFSNPFYLLRDWGWDTDEPAIMCDKIKEMLPADIEMESLLVLGAGGCGESYILHQHYNCPLTLSLEIDPFKLLAAEHVISGGELNLYQILQNNIRTASDNVSYWQLRAPARPQPGFLYLLGDARKLPVAHDAFHVVLTPFLIDEIGEDLRLLARRIYDTVQPGGYWANYGVLMFRPEFGYTGEEVLSIVEETGFRLLNHGYARKAHVAPKESCLQQVFDCLYFTAVKDS